MKKNIILFFLFLSIAFWVSHNNQRTDYWCHDQHFEEYQSGVMNHTIFGPLAYRVMIPYAVDFLNQAFHLGSEKFVVFCLNILILTLTQLAFFFYLKNFFSDVESLLGILWLDLAIMMSFTSFIGVHVYETTDLCNLLFMIIAMHLLFNQKWIWLYLILFISMINRETPAFLLIPIFVLAWKKKIPMLNSIICAASLLIPYFGLKFMIHPPQPSWFLTVYLNENIPFVKNADYTAIKTGYIKLILLLGPVTWLALTNFKLKNEFLRTMILIIIFYIPVHLIIGHLEEYRLWIPLFLILIPLALQTIHGWNNGKAVIRE